jgi:hypothetical protein
MKFTLTAPPASIEIGNYMRYEENYQDGLRYFFLSPKPKISRHGPGKAFVWSTKKNAFRMSEEGQFRLDRLYTGRSFPESKPEKNMSYVDGT